jgi:Ricin-type beta-trefoil lectin domain
MCNFLRIVGTVIVAFLSGSAACNAVQLISTQSGACVEVQGGNATDGTPIDVYQCTGSLNQNWTISTGQIAGIGGGCLDVNLSANAASKNGSIILVACNEKRSQKWTVSNGQIIGLGGKCLEMMGTGASINTSLTLSKCTAAIAQQWLLQ